MRLDHLLSKEQCEGETWSAHPKVDLSESLVKEAEEAKKLFLLAVSFSGSVQEKAVLSPPLVWGFSSVGRAPALQAGGQRFEPANLHHMGR